MLFFRDFQAGHFLPDEDDKFLERVQATVEEKEHQAAATANTDAAKESRKAIQSVGPELKDGSHNIDVVVVDEVTKTEKDGSSDVATEAEPEQKQLEAKGHGRAYDSVETLPLEFYHYYHGSNTDMEPLLRKLYILIGGKTLSIYG